MEKEEIQQAFKDLMDELERDGITVTDLALELIDAYFELLEESEKPDER